MIHFGDHHELLSPSYNTKYIYINRLSETLLLTTLLSVTLYSPSSCLVPPFSMYCVTRVCVCLKMSSCVCAVCVCAILWYVCVYAIVCSSVCVYLCVYVDMYHLCVCGYVVTCTHKTTSLQIFMSSFLKWAHANLSIIRCDLPLSTLSIMIFFYISVLTCHLS